MKPWNYDHYKEFIRAWIENRPMGGRGELKKMASHLGVHTTLLSHVINGEKDFSHEQLIELSGYLGLSPFEVEYLYVLHARDRAGTYGLQQFHDKKLKELKMQALKIKNRVKVGKSLGLKEKQIFYSSYLYCALRLLSAIPKFQTIDGLMEKTGIERKRLIEVIDFLLECGLIVEENGFYNYGPKSTHISEEDPLVLNHHKNWRLKALEKMEGTRAQHDQLFFTMPVVLTEVEAVQIKNILLESIEKITKISDPAECEELYVLNVDWFKF